jgi:predicted ABC-type ATPase
VADAAAAESSCIYVLAGANGAGKSTVGGATIRGRGADYFNPDEAARRIRAEDPAIGAEQANSLAWHMGRRLLERAIAERLTFALETTLGGETMTRLLARAIAQGVAVRMWYVALESPELHIARVKARAARGGHDIPDAKIRERYDASRRHLIRLLPSLTELRLFDNSVEADPAKGIAPAPLLVLHMVQGRIAAICELRLVPAWAKPIVAAAMKAAEW